MAGEKIVSVLVPVAVAAPYTYRAPAGRRSPATSSRCRSARATWSAWSGTIRPTRRSATIGSGRSPARFDAPPLSKEIRAFVDWVADYTLTSRGMVLRMVLRAPGALEPEAPVAGRAPRRAAAGAHDAGAGAGAGAARRRARPGRSPASPPRPASAPSVVQGLVDAGTLEVVMMPAAPPAPPPDPDYGKPALSAEQEAAAAALRAAVAAGGYSVTLLDGVTGSGKTEVYFEAVAEALRQRAGRC